jgi:hypothetical protein
MPAAGFPTRRSAFANGPRGRCVDRRRPQPRLGRIPPVILEGRTGMAWWNPAGSFPPSSWIVPNRACRVRGLAALFVTPPAGYDARGPARKNRLALTVSGCPPNNPTRRSLVFWRRLDFGVGSRTPIRTSTIRCRPSEPRRHALARHPQQFRAPLSRRIARGLGVKSAEFGVFGDLHERLATPLRVRRFRLAPLAEGSPGRAVAPFRFATDAAIGVALYAYSATSDAKEHQRQEFVATRPAPTNSRRGAIERAVPGPRRRYRGRMSAAGKPRRSARRSRMAMKLDEAKRRYSPCSRCRPA